MADRYVDVDVVTSMKVGTYEYAVSLQGRHR